MLEDLREAAHRDQVTVTGRYLGLRGRWLDGRPTRQPCSLQDEIVGLVRFDIRGDNPWSARPARIDVKLPCPELSRRAYAKLYHYDPDDKQRDGLGHAPLLREGQRYRLTFVRNPVTVPDEDVGVATRRFSPTLVAVDPP